MQDKPTLTKTGKDASAAILRGVNHIFEIAKFSIGPAAKSVLTYGTYGREPRIFKDGHQAFQVIEPKDEFENLVARTFREAAAKTNEKAGDATTGTALVGGYLINKLLSKESEFSGAYIATSKMNVRQTCKDLLKMSKEISDRVLASAIKIKTVEDLEKIAITSVGDEELGKTIAAIAYEIGVDGFADVIEGFKGKIETEVIKGMRFPAKVSAKAFVNNPARYEMIATDCPVLITNYKFDNDQQVAKALTPLLNKNSKLVIICPDYSEQILINMVQTIKKGGVAIFPIKAPSLRTEQFEDLAVYFDAVFIDKQTGKKLENVEDSDLGFADKIVVKDTDAREDAIATGGRGTVEGKMKVDKQEYATSSKVAERIKMLKGQMEETKVEMHKKVIERRIGSMASAVAIIRVGASSRAELMPKKLKIEDAIYACKSALEEGYVKGGGLALKEISDAMVAELGDKITKVQTALLNAIRFPYDQIQLLNEEKLEIPDTIIDSAKSIRLEVEHAVSVAANLLTVGAIIPEIREKSPVEGYETIAQAIMLHNKLWAKKEGIWKENIDEFDKDNQQRAEENLANDTG